MIVYTIIQVVITLAAAGVIGYSIFLTVQVSGDRLLAMDSTLGYRYAVAYRQWQLYAGIAIAVLLFLWVLYILAWRRYRMKHREERLAKKTAKKEAKRQEKQKKKADAKKPQTAAGDTVSDSYDVSMQSYYPNGYDTDNRGYYPNGYAAENQGYYPNGYAAENQGYYPNGYVANAQTYMPDTYGQYISSDEKNAPDTKTGMK
jgi:hypothetical protein